MSASLQEVKEIAAELLGVDINSLKTTTGVGDIPEWDSLAQLSIVTTLEEKYNLNIDPEVMMEVSTIADLVQLVDGHVSSSKEQSKHIAYTATIPVNTSHHQYEGTQLPPYDTQPVVCTIMQRAAETPAKTALIFAHESINYFQLIQGAQAAAAWLKKRGVKRGDTVAVYSEKQKEFYFVYFGIHLLGAAVLNLDPEIKEERRSFIYAQTAPSLSIGNVIHADARYSDIDIVTQPSVPFDGPDMEDIADIMFTTGTTGAPKGVILTQRNVAAAAWHINSFIGTTGDDIDVIALPICHSFGIGRSRCLLVVGGTIVMAPGFSNVKRLFSIIQNYKATGLAIVPAAWSYLHQMSGDKIAEFASSLRYIEIGGAPMPEYTRRHLMNLFPHTRICMYYGLTEASRSTFMEFHSESLHLDTCGRPSPGVEVAVFSENGELLSSGMEGEICIKGNHVMKGYLHTPRESTYYGEYFRSGDWGMIDADGYVYVHSRKKDMINTGGKKVSPEELEDILNTIPGIFESACVPAPDPNGILGEVVKAIVVSDGSERPTDETIRSIMTNRVEHYKVPVFVEWRDNIQRTATGKIQRQFMK